MPLFFGSFAKALLDVFEFPISDDLGYKLDLPATGEADELSLILLSSGLGGEYIYDIAEGLDETQLSKYRSGKRQVHSEIVERYKTPDVRERVEPFFRENITPNVPIERRYDLIQTLLNLIEEDKRISDRQKHIFRESALNDSLNNFLVEVFIYAMKSSAPKISRDEQSTQAIYGNGNYRVYNCPYDPSSVFMERDELDYIRQNYAKGNRLVAICGEEGIGKTELALRYACEAALDLRRAVIWIDAEDEGSILRSIRQFLLEKNLNKNATRAKLVADSVVIEEFLAWAGTNNDWLIVFDNVGAEMSSNQACLQYFPRLNNGDILLTISGEAPAEAIKIVLKPQEDNSASYDYLRSRYENRHLVSVFSASPPLTFRNIPFVLEIMSGYALATGDFELDVVTDSRIGFIDLGSNKDIELGMIVPIRSYSYLERRLSELSCEELIQKAVRVAWNCIDARYKFLLQLAAWMPSSEIRVEMLEEMFFSGTDYDYYRKVIPLAIGEYMTHADKFTDILRQLIALGVCKAAYYAKEDPRWNAHFSGLKKIRLHHLVCKYVKEQKGYDGISEAVILEMIEKISKQ